jgi:DNA-binding transcriptional MerR regulator
MEQPTPQPLPPDKLYFTISEVAEHTGVPATTIRSWEGTFGPLASYHSGNGKRHFTVADIARIQRIWHLTRDKGLTLAGARAELKPKRHKTQPRGRIQSLEDVQVTLLKVKFYLEETLKRL